MFDKVPIEIAIIGGGAAGCFAAANLHGLRAGSVVVFEKSGKLLQKVKVSGGGRCNVTHQLFEVPTLIGRYPRGQQWLRKALYQFGPKDTIEWFAARNVLLKAEADGRMFPTTDSSQTIIDSLQNAMHRAGVQICFHKSLTGLAPTTDGFCLQFADDTEVFARKVLLACGGYPKLAQYEWLQALEIPIEPPVPSLFSLNAPNDPIVSLMGVSVPQATVRVVGAKVREEGPVLITHWGLSGPAVLRASAWGAREFYNRDYACMVTVNWVGERSEWDIGKLLADQRHVAGKSLIASRNPTELPKRLWAFLVQLSGVPEGARWGELTVVHHKKLLQLLVNYPVTVSGKTTYKEEFVTCGGVALSAVHPQTMESRSLPGLYFAGEILDVDGITGGFNFQHAWASGYLAAASIKQCLMAQT